VLARTELELHPRELLRIATEAGENNPVPVREATSNDPSLEPGVLGKEPQPTVGAHTIAITACSSIDQQQRPHLRN